MRRAGRRGEPRRGTDPVVRSLTRDQDCRWDIALLFRLQWRKRLPTPATRIQEDGAVLGSHSNRDPETVADDPRSRHRHEHESTQHQRGNLIAGTCHQESRESCANRVKGHSEDGYRSSERESGTLDERWHPTLTGRWLTLYHTLSSSAPRQGDHKPECLPDHMQA